MLKSSKDVQNLINACGKKDICVPIKRPMTYIFTNHK